MNAQNNFIKTNMAKSNQICNHNREKEYFNTSINYTSHKMELISDFRAKIGLKDTSKTKFSNSVTVPSRTGLQEVYHEGLNFPRKVQYVLH